MEEEDFSILLGHKLHFWNERFHASGDDIRLRTGHLYPLISVSFPISV